LSGNHDEALIITFLVIKNRFAPETKILLPLPTSFSRELLRKLQRPKLSAGPSSPRCHLLVPVGDCFSPVVRRPSSFSV